jgi:hypothetical protein
MANFTTIQKLNLYRNLIREGRQLTNYNFREYALRRTRDGFRINQNLTDEAKINEQLNYALEDLEVLKRQVIISKLYKNDKLVIE